MSNTAFVIEPGFARRMEHRLLNETDLPGFGINKCITVLKAYGSLYNLSRVPRVLALGAPGLTKEAREGLYEALDNEVFLGSIKAIAKHRMAVLGRPKKPLAVFSFEPILEHVLGIKVTRHTLHFINDRWKKGISLHEAITAKTCLGITIRDEHHWELVKIMRSAERVALCQTLDVYRWTIRPRPLGT